jgi:hypothetical protein
MLTTKQISTKIGGIKRSSKSLRDNVQIVLAHTCGHVLEHGNVTLFNNLLAASVGVNKGKLIGYAKQYGFVSYDHAKGTFSLNKKARTEATEKYSDGDSLISFLGKQPKWYEETATLATVDGVKELAPDLDVTKRIENLAKAVTNAKGKVLDAGLVKALKELNEALNVAHGADVKAA